MKIIWSPLARDDLTDIFRFILIENPPAAAKIYFKIEELAGLLGEFPEMGHRSVRSPGNREIVISGTPYLIIYDLRAGAVEILRVYHAARRSLHEGT